MEVFLPNPVVSVSASSNLNVAYTTNNTFFSWGSVIFFYKPKNDKGDCGKGTTSTLESTPVLVDLPEQETYSDIFCCRDKGCSVVISSGSDIYSWGEGQFGQIGVYIFFLSFQDGFTTNKPTPVKADIGLIIPTMTFTGIACGARHTLVISQSSVGIACWFGYYFDLRG